MHTIHGAHGSSCTSSVSAAAVCLPAGSNPEYAFLTPGGTDHDFFRWALFATGCGIPVDTAPPQGFAPPPAPQQQQQPAAVPTVQQPPQYMPPQQQFYSVPPPQQPYAGQPYPQHPMQYQQPHAVQPQQPPPRPAPPPIAPEVAAGFSQVLDNLSGSKVRTADGRDTQTACAQHTVGSAYAASTRISWCSAHTVWGQLVNYVL